MLEIRAIMNSPMEEILAFKTCCSLRAFDQNLEILIKNKGEHPIRVPSYFDLQGSYGTQRIDTLLPAGEQRIDPGGIIAFYCYMDDAQWAMSETLVFYDSTEKEYKIPVVHEAD